MVLLVSCHLTFRWWSDWVDVSSKCYEFINYGILTISSQFRWGVVYWTLQFSSIYFSWCFFCTTLIVIILITVKKTFYNQFLNTPVVLLILYTDPLGIITISFHVYAEVINKKVGNICWSLQGSISINSHMFACMLFVF